MDDNNVEKTINFFRLVLNKNGEDVDPLTVFSYIKSLPFTKDDHYLIKDGRYLAVNEGNLHLMHIYEDLPFNALPLKISLGTSRRKNLPSVEENGVQSPLDIEGGLFEPTHAMIFSNNIIGIESNYYGPHAQSIEKYISRKALSLVDNVELIPLMRTDFLDYISQIGEIKLLEFKVHRNMTKYFEEINKSLSHILNGMKDSSDAEYIGISFNSARRRGMNLKFKNKFLNRFQNQEYRDAANKAIIKATDINTNKTRVFNLLEPYFISYKEVLKNDDIHRSIDRESMFEAIEESYSELKDEIEGIITTTNRSNKNYQSRLAVS